MIRRGIGEFSPTAPFQLEKNLQHAPHLVAAGMPLLLGLKLVLNCIAYVRVVIVVSALCEYLRNTEILAKLFQPVHKKPSVKFVDQIRKGKTRPLSM